MNALRLLAPIVTALLLGCSPAPGPDKAGSGPPDLSGVWMAFAVENPDGGGNTPRYSE